jgi:hypothetical protein
LRFATSVRPSDRKRKPKRSSTTEINDLDSSTAKSDNPPDDLESGGARPEVPEEAPVLLIDCRELNHSRDLA